VIDVASEALTAIEDGIGDHLLWPCLRHPTNNGIVRKEVGDAIHVMNSPVAHIERMVVGNLMRYMDLHRLHWWNAGISSSWWHLIDNIVVSPVNPLAFVLEDERTKCTP